jgi:hypothetical protein
MLAGPFGCGGGGGGGATPVPAMGSLEIGFVDSPSKAFQAISVNIVSVRLNPSPTTVSDADPNWVTVTAPPGSGPGELSVNLLDFQNDAVVFNIGQITAQTYHQVEVVFDAALPGMVIPSCTSGTQEGCITANASFTGSTNLVTTFSAGIQITSGGLTPLIIDINPGNPVPPAAPGGNYTLNPSITVVPNTAGFLATVMGTVSGLSSLSGDTINAELTGTNSIVAQAPLPASGFYSIQLPAAVNGTSYDLFVSGTTTFAVASDLTLTRGGPVTTQNLVVTSAGSPVSIVGAVIDARTKGALVGATVNLLLAQKSSVNCMTSNGVGCVVVDTTTSNSAGNYILAEPSPPAGTPYYVQAITTGTETQILPVAFSGTTGICAGSPNPNNCSFSLNNDLITGTIMVDPPPAAGTNVLVTVIAEQTGTGNLVGLTQAAVGFSGSAPFSMEVPPAPPNPNVDLIASAQDAYLGVGTQFSGHQLAVAPNVAPGGVAPTLTVSCLGHGTIAGVANSSDGGTHVRLFQSGVQLMDSTVGSTVPVPGATSTPAFPNQYSFCAPPNTYTVQRFEETAATTVPVGPSPSIVVPTPAPTAGPCPLCANPTGQCPGNCSATNASPL